MLSSKNNDFQRKRSDNGGIQTKGTARGSKGKGNQKRRRAQKANRRTQEFKYRGGEILGRVQQPRAQNVPA